MREIIFYSVIWDFLLLPTESNLKLIFDLAPLTCLVPELTALKSYDYFISYSETAFIIIILAILDYSCTCLPLDNFYEANIMWSFHCIPST